MKAIKGLEDRLYALDQMIASCKKLVNEQKELAQVYKAEVEYRFLRYYVLLMYSHALCLHISSVRDFWPIRSGLKTLRIRLFCLTCV